MVANRSNSDVSPGFPPRMDISIIHAHKLRLCDELEAIADALPSQVDQLQCLTVANSLTPVLRESHGFEEKIVFPAFARAEGGQAVIERLIFEHREDECAAEDVGQALLAYGHGWPIENPEALGYMLRALFETLRRHIAFEKDHVLPALVERIRPG